MKKIIYITIALGLLLTSCDVDYSPRADFDAPQLVEPYEYIYFTNFSTHADYFVWDFGDGYSSNIPNPTHNYSNEGIYKVTLAAYQGNEVSYAIMEIEVYYTTLEVRVIDWETYDDPSLSLFYVPNATVKLYTNESDYVYQVNPVATAITDRYGTVVFKGLEPIEYWVDVYRANDYHNFWLYEDDYNFVLTLPLDKATHNVFDAFVDYIPQTMSAPREAVRPVLKSTGRKAPERIKK